MSDSEDSWPLPNYDPGKPKHLHAVGVISMNYNAFERTLYSLYRLHLDRKKIPLRLGELYYFTLNEQSRLAAIRAVFDEYERNEKVREVAESSLKFFDWCSNVRNSILHAHHYPLLSGSSDEALHLTKRKNKRSSEQGYLRFDLPQLRAFGDAFHHGNQHCARLYVHLRQRGRPMSKWNTFLMVRGREPLPEILATPTLLTMADHPVDPIRSLRPRSSTA